jgi:hypothetical protein
MFAIFATSSVRRRQASITVFKRLITDNSRGGRFRCGVTAPTLAGDRCLLDARGFRKFNVLRAGGREQRRNESRAKQLS